MKKYNIIYADPPWKYWAGGKKNATKHYGCMEIEDIYDLPVGELADDNCALFLWVTFPILKESLELIERWGFRYVTCAFTWVKRNKSGKGWFFGLGNYTRANAEICLLGIKGKIKRNENNISQILDSKIREHSRKPDETRRRIIKLMGDLPRIELFARQKFDGWDVWGNQAPTEVQRELSSLKR